MSICVPSICRGIVGVDRIEEWTAVVGIIG